MNPRALAAAAAALVAITAAAQYALDASLSTASRINPTRPRPAVQRDIYTINRATGTMVYNRANAFNDDVYSIHQRYTHDRFGNFTPAGVSTGANAAAPRSYTSRYAGTPAAYRAPTTQSMPTRRVTTPAATTTRTASRAAVQPGRTRVAASSWNIPTDAYVTPVRSVYTGTTTPASGAGLAAPTYNTMSAPLPPPPERAIVRPQGYSVARDSEWPHR